MVENKWDAPWVKDAGEKMKANEKAEFDKKVSEECARIINMNNRKDSEAALGELAIRNPELFAGVKKFMEATGVQHWKTMTENAEKNAAAAKKKFAEIRQIKDATARNTAYTEVYRNDKALYNLLVAEAATHHVGLAKVDNQTNQNRTQTNQTTAEPKSSSRRLTKEEKRNVYEARRATPEQKERAKQDGRDIVNDGKTVIDFVEERRRAIDERFPSNDGELISLKAEKSQQKQEERKISPELLKKAYKEYMEGWEQDKDNERERRIRNLGILKVQDPQFYAALQEYVAKERKNSNELNILRKGAEWGDKIEKRLRETGRTPARRAYTGEAPEEMQTSNDVNTNEHESTREDVELEDISGNVLDELVITGDASKSNKKSETSREEAKSAGNSETENESQAKGLNQGQTKEWNESSAGDAAGGKAADDEEKTPTREDIINMVKSMDGMGGKIDDPEKVADALIAWAKEYYIYEGAPNPMRGLKSELHNIIENPVGMAYAVSPGDEIPDAHTPVAALQYRMKNMTAQDTQDGMLQAAESIKPEPEPELTAEEKAARQEIIETLGNMKGGKIENPELAAEILIYHQLSVDRRENPNATLSEAMGKVKDLLQKCNENPHAFESYRPDKDYADTPLEALYSYASYNIDEGYNVLGIEEDESIAYGNMVKKIEYMNSVNAKYGAEQLDETEYAQKLQELYGNKAIAVLDKALLSPREEYSEAAGEEIRTSREAVKHLAGMSKEEAQKFAAKLLKEDENTGNESAQNTAKSETRGTATPSSNLSEENKQKMMAEYTQMKQENPELYAKLEKAFSEVLTNGSASFAGIIDTVEDLCRKYGYMDGSAHLITPLARDSQAIMQEIDNNAKSKTRGTTTPSSNLSEENKQKMMAEYAQMKQENPELYAKLEKAFSDLLTNGDVSATNMAEIIDTITELCAKYGYTDITPLAQDSQAIMQEIDNNAKGGKTQQGETKAFEGVKGVKVERGTTKVDKNGRVVGFEPKGQQAQQEAKSKSENASAAAGKAEKKSQSENTSAAGKTEKKSKVFESLQTAQRALDVVDEAKRIKEGGISEVADVALEEVDRKIGAHNKASDKKDAKSKEDLSKQMSTDSEKARKKIAKLEEQARKLREKAAKQKEKGNDKKAQNYEKKAQEKENQAAAIKENPELASDKKKLKEAMNKTGRTVSNAANSAVNGVAGAGKAVGHFFSGLYGKAKDYVERKKVLVDAAQKDKTVYTLSGFEGRDPTDPDKLCNGIYTIKKDKDGKIIGVTYQADKDAEPIELNDKSFPGALRNAGRDYPAERHSKARGNTNE